MMKRKPIFLSVLAVGAMVSVLSVGSLLSKLPGPWSAPDRASQIEAGENESSSVLAYVDLPAKERAEILAETAKGSKSIDRHRARYLLATDLIAQDRGGQALPLLDGLEKSYPVLEAQILAKRAQSQAATGDATEAEKTWKALIKQHPENPATAEALFQLGRKDSKYWDQALEKFPAHPRSLEIV